MIYIYPVGGLGNMLFHIASIWTLAKDNNDELCLLKISDKIKECESYKNADLKHANKYMYLFDRFNIFDGKIKNSIKYDYGYSSLKYKKGYKYQGFFQSEKYFLHRRKEILYLFRQDDSFGKEINRYLNFYGNIGLHVRRGDYLFKKDKHPPQDIIYYKKALSQFPKDLKVLVFSDDMGWCKENFIGNRFIFVDEFDYISLYIMSKMKYHVISNSSFGWWGAWLSEISKYVICPKIWFISDKFSDKDVVPKNWFKM